MRVGLDDRDEAGLVAQDVGEFGFVDAERRGHAATV
jgi:hypothetical protein